jgi:hypothetical protein
MSDGIDAERYGARLGLSIVIDSMIAREQTDATLQLVEWDQEGWIILRSSDMLHTEVNNTPHEGTRLRSQARIARMPMNRGVLAFDTGGSLIGAESDQALFDEVFAAMWLGVDRTLSSRRNKNRRRDTQHICTAIRYGESIFITRDGEQRSGKHHERGILDSAGKIQRRWALQIMTPERAVALVQRRIDRYEVRHSTS